MPRQRGLFSRLTGALGKVFTGLGDFFERKAEPGPPAPPPPPSPPVPPPTGLTRESRIWRDVAKGNDRYDSGQMSEWFEMYRNAVDPLQLDDDEFDQFWEEFLRAYYLTTGERGHIKRDRFHRDLGVQARDWEMDWEEWRQLKRGTP